MSQKPLKIASVFQISSSCVISKIRGAMNFLDSIKVSSLAKANGWKNIEAQKGMLSFEIVPDGKPRIRINVWCKKGTLAIQTSGKQLYKHRCEYDFLERVFKNENFDKKEFKIVTQGMPEYRPKELPLQQTNERPPWEEAPVSADTDIMEVPKTVEYAPTGTGEYILVSANSVVDFRASAAKRGMTEQDYFAKIVEADRLTIAREDWQRDNHQK